MREYKFRGKRIDNGEWVYGSLVIDTDLNQYAICGFNYYNGDTGLEREPFNELVDPETVGQYTGLKDRNGMDIYEGDVVRIVEYGFDNVNDIDYFEQWLVNENVISHTIDEDGYISYEFAKQMGTVVLDRFPRYWLKNETFGYAGEDLIDHERCEVIGSIHTHPHLLEQGEKE